LLGGKKVHPRRQNPGYAYGTTKSDPRIPRRNCINTSDTIYSCTHNTAVYAIIQQQRRTVADPSM